MKILIHNSDYPESWTPGSPLFQETKALADRIVAVFRMAFNDAGIKTVIVHLASKCLDPECPLHHPHFVKWIWTDVPVDDTLLMALAPPPGHTPPTVLTRRGQLLFFTSPIKTKKPYNQQGDR